MYMDTVFEFSAPCSKYELTKKNIKEFQIKHKLSQEFLEIYYEHNKQTFLECVYTYIRLTYSNVIKEQGVDFHYDDSNTRTPHIYIHVDLNENANKVVQTIIDDLHKQFLTQWVKSKIPKLMTIIKHKLNDNDTFQHALESYRSKHGVEKTKTFQHVYSNQILWYYNDISFLSNRHKYDFQ